MNFDNFKFHPSQIGRLMSESRTKEQWSETAKSYLLECYINHKYGRYKDISNKYMEKGTLAEEDSIDLYSIVKKQYFEKNKEKIENDYFIGTPDLYLGESVLKANLIIDIKSSWSIFTFYETMLKPLNKDYKYQLNAYMDLTGAKEARLVYCLVNTPIHLVEDEKKKTMWKMGIIDPDTDEAYLEACRRIELNAYYDDIPEEDRYVDFIIERNDTDIERMHNRIIEARNFLNQLNNGTDYLRKH